MDRRNFLAGGVLILASIAGMASGASMLLQSSAFSIRIREASYTYGHGPLSEGLYFLYYAEGHHSEPAFRLALRRYLTPIMGEGEAAGLALEAPVAHEYFADHGVYDELGHIHVVDELDYVAPGLWKSKKGAPGARPVTSTGWV